MKISEEMLQKYRELYKNRFGVELPREEAFTQAHQLVNLMNSIYQPMTKEGYRALQKRRGY